MDSYIKTIINGIKAWVANRLNCLEENLGKKIDAAKRTADTAKSTAESKADSQNPVFSGSFSQNRKAETIVGNNSHAEGNNTTATGYASHAEGNNTTANGYASHAEGSYTTASGNYSHAEGYYTTASGVNSHVEGKFNIEDTTGKYAHIVGNGTSTTNRSNAHTLDWNGVGWFAGGLKVGGTGQDDEAAVDVALKTDIPNTAPVVFTDEGGNLVNANGETAGAEEIYNTLLSGVVYVKKNDVYQVVQNFLYEEGPKITLVIQDHIESDGITRYEVTL